MKQVPTLRGILSRIKRSYDVEEFISINKFIYFGIICIIRETMYSNLSEIPCLKIKI